ncbi:hypothetical protein, variant 2 [Phialophora macrospora]|uniref:C2H2 type master regulator of conidiophore development brlA n=1 Tax=Phialophora macrospora TaxID=1851006 RepID=A0A0D2F471_9EURO|nr:hypothetical protein, variant 1 [Phialophora macrospora]KIW62704.1 hypothetical protein, variant 2 [Phialophora macrospora]
MSHQESFYDFDRDILNRTPPLVAVKPSLEPHDSPAPLVPVDASSDSTDVEDTDGVGSSRKKKKRKDPNQNELASHVERHALESASQSEVEEEDNDAGRRRQMSRSSDVVQSGATQSPARRRDIVISNSSVKEDDWPMIDTPANAADAKYPRSPPSVSGDGRRPRHQEQDQASNPAVREDPPKKQFDTRPPPLNEKLGLKLKPSRGPAEEDEDSIIKSPALAKFAIARDDAPPDFILPALQKTSPPRSSPAGPLDLKHNLPSIKTAIGDLPESSFSRFASMSPMGRPSPIHLAQYASPATYSALSPRAPMGPPSHHEWRATTRDSNTSTASSYASSSATGSTPASSMTVPSPAPSYPSPSYPSPSHPSPPHPSPSDPSPSHPQPSQPSPLAPVPEEDTEAIRRDSFDESESKIKSESQSEPPPGDGFPTDGSPAGRYIGGAYICMFHGCTASPFQTQYLLNSHMNVHSNSRTHFCSVKGCPRGPGGQGFKRKNEMIRHGLVHKSPGYICPFCPDQEHRYPRPDNLQRHVRQHHADKDRDDPVLRDVLDQRIEGGTRGGRRRMRL